MTDAERETARLTWLECSNASSPLSDLGCYFAYTGVWCVVAFGGGFVLGAIVGIIAGPPWHALRYGLWGGAILAAVAAIVTIRGHVMMAAKSWREDWQHATDTHDFGDVDVIECETDAVALCAHGNLVAGPVYILSVGDGWLLVLRGAYVDDFHDEQGFPHERFEIEVNLRGLVSNYRPAGDALSPMLIDYDRCDETERAALDGVPDQTVLRGEIHTCLADLARKQ
ncbi:MAG TPA: hypothetical protein QGH10_21580 [Armatimonadota bacterium]|nr:hypothetical protein [Armatimonadota bacterium]